MTLTFLIKSDTANISNYTIKDIPGSTGRLDVISRCILAALFTNNILEKDIKIYVFLGKLGNFLFDSDKIVEDLFPKNELLLTDLLVKTIKLYTSEEYQGITTNEGIKRISEDIFKVITLFKKNNFKIFILSEDGEEILKMKNYLDAHDDLIFIVGNQTGNFLQSQDLKKLELPKISLGSRSYLASSVIRLIKLNLIL
ncbi:MAG: hypothetical protein P8Y70_12160 [Candidatus Lokiarchaeota archaeon]